jgi:tetratricopeptide (TPR) repeat protein
MTQTNGNNDPRVVEGIKQAMSLDQMGETEAAISELTILLDEFPNAASLHGYIALYLSNTGRLEEAIKHGGSAVRLSPKSEKASLVLFQALSKAQRFIDALDEAKRFLALKPSEEYSRMIEEWKLGDALPAVPESNDKH